MSTYHKEWARSCHDIIFDIFMDCNDVRRTGSAAVELCLLASGYADLYFELRLMPWDSTQWISMRDEQPDHDGKYLVFNGLLEDWFKGENHDMMIGIFSWYKAKGGWYSLTFEKPITTVTHWMELPAVPEGWGCDAAD
jgi:hypothetical protein